MKKTSEQDTTFCVPRHILIWKCVKPLSESVRCAVKTQQQVLKTVCKMYCVSSIVIERSGPLNYLMKIVARGWLLRRFKVGEREKERKREIEKEREKER